MFGPNFGILDSSSGENTQFLMRNPSFRSGIRKSGVQGPTKLRENYLRQFICRFGCSLFFIRCYTQILIVVNFIVVNFFDVCLSQLGILRSAFGEKMQKFFFFTSRTFLKPAGPPQNAGKPNLDTKIQKKHISTTIEFRA